jgi:predicted O-methyltransferase YrrM
MSFEQIERPFNGEQITKEEFLRLAILGKCNTVVETGTYRAQSTVWFAKLFPEVHTIESDKNYYEQAKEIFKNTKHVYIHPGASEVILKDLLPVLKSNNKKPIFYLDAHLGEYCPLNDEIKHIAATFPDESIIVIDDFFVPAFPHYSNNKYTMGYLADSLKLAYPKGYIYYYNSRTIHPDNFPTGRVHIVPTSLNIPQGWLKEFNGEMYSNV